MKLNRTGGGDLKAHCSSKAVSWGNAILDKLVWILVEVNKRRNLERSTGNKRIDIVDWILLSILFVIPSD